ncbi:MAG: hypothetical protein RL757_2653 [Bacteroidota bacterium]|jgi:hypothetical protein
MDFLDFKIFLTNENELQKNSLQSDAPKRCLVLFDDENGNASTDFLKKILSAAKLNPDADCQIVGIPTDLEGVLSLSNRLAANDVRQILVFGIAPAQLGLRIAPPQYQPFFFNNCQWLFVEKCTTIEQNIEIKKKLWANLQAIFL